MCKNSKPEKVQIWAIGELKGTESADPSKDAGLAWLDGCVLCSLDHTWRSPSTPSVYFSEWPAKRTYLDDTNGNGEGHGKETIWASDKS